MSKRAALEELYRRKRVRDTLVKELHPVQLKVFNDPSQYRACCASRRGGKTFLDVTEITLALLDSGPGVWTVFIGPTAGIAKELVWDDLVQMDKRFNLGWDMKEHPSPLITTPAGAKFRLCGVDDKAQLGKLRGKKYKLVLCDEAKEYTNFLRELVDEVIGPAFMGVGGRMMVSGTPGRACTEKDYWFAINKGLKPGWSAHSWTLHSNPWIEDAEAELKKVRTNKEWSEENAIYQREYLGRWVSDTSERVYAYTEGKNSVSALADVAYTDPLGNRHPYDRATWIHTLSADFGYKPDPCAWVVWASHPKSRDVFAVYARKQGELLSDEAALETARLVELYKPLSIVGDGGGLGSPYLADYNRRHADRLRVWMKQANKKGKRDHIEIMSEELKVGRIFVVLSEAGPLADEWVNLGWKDDEREHENPAQPNHCADAGLYGFMEHKALYHKLEPAPLTAEEKALEERRARTKLAQSRQTKSLLR